MTNEYPLLIKFGYNLEASSKWMIIEVSSSLNELTINSVNDCSEANSLISYSTIFSIDFLSIYFADSYFYED